MTRSVAPSERLAQLRGRLDKLSNAPSSKRRNLLDEPSKPDNKKPSKRPADFKRALARVTEYGVKVTEGLWECEGPDHLVGLYAALHTHVYGVPALELEQDYGAAVSSARKLLTDEWFHGSAFKAQTYVAWCFARARKWKQQSIKDGEEVVRLNWRTVFMKRKWLTDWKANVCELAVGLVSVTWK